MALIDNLVAYYKYNQGGLLVDSSGNGKTLTNNNSVAEASDGKFGYCADFGSSGTKKSLSSPVNLGTGNFTINFWQKYDSIPGYDVLQCLCSIRVNGTKTNHEFDYRNESGTPKYNLWTGSGSGEVKYNITESTGVYYMLTLTYDGSNLRLYRNTSLVLTLSTGSNTTSDATKIMFGNRASSFGNTRSVDGKQDEAGVWSRVITAQEMSDLYNDGAGLTYPFVFVAPTVTTSSVTNIATNSGLGNGNVTDDGNATITERGICWNTSPNPTTANSKSIATGTTGAFSADIHSLTTGTTYYVRAYATNSVGTSYGSEVTFSPSQVSLQQESGGFIKQENGRTFIF